MCDTPEFAADKKAAIEFGEKLRPFLSIKTRRYFIWTFPRCFVGKEAVDVMLTKDLVKTRQEAVIQGQRLLDHRVIHHVADDHLFEDSELFYRYMVDETELKDGPAATALIAECNGVTAFGPVSQKGRLWGWNQRYLVLKANEFRVYVFNAEQDPAPNSVILLDDQSRVQEVAEAKAGQFGLLLSTAQLTTTFSFDSQKEKDVWLRAFGDAGVMVGKFVPLQNVNSLFDISAHDIDGKEMSLAAFRGQVTLIVNVACE